MQFSLQGPVAYWYYYPLKGNFDGKHPGTAESWSPTRRPINRDRGEIAEWILIDGSPTTASNSGLFNQNASSATRRRNAKHLLAQQRRSTWLFRVRTLEGIQVRRLRCRRGRWERRCSLARGREEYRRFVRTLHRQPSHLCGPLPRPWARLDPPTLRTVAAQANTFAASLIHRLYTNWDNEPDVGCYIST